jgi:antitoxin VapB
MDTGKLFMNGNSHAVRLPKEYRFGGEEVVVQRMGNAVALLPQDNPWQTLVDALAEFPADTCLVRDQPAISGDLCATAPVDAARRVTLAAPA